MSTEFSRSGSRLGRRPVLVVRCPAADEDRADAQSAEEGSLRDCRAPLVRANGSRRQRVRTERTTAELCAGDPLWWAYPQTSLRRIGGLSPFGIAHGITYGDGSLFGQSASVDLHGDKDAELLKWFPLSRSYQCGYDGNSSGVRKPYIKVVDLPRFFKDRPSLDESPQYLAGWLAGYFAADGCVAADGTVMLNSADRSNLEFVRDGLHPPRCRDLRHHDAEPARHRRSP